MELITNYTAEEEQLVIQTALQKKQLKVYEDQVSNKHFNLRNHSIQQYFMRLSFYNKKKCILQFVEKLSSPANTFQILSNMSLSHIKMESYALTDPKTENIHHKLIWDHDRMLDKGVLLETMENDLQWFETLDDDKQFKLLMGLIELCNGSVKRGLYMPLFRIYSTTLSNFMHSHYTHKMSADSLKSSDVSVDPLQDDPEFDPKHPSSIEVQKQRKKWFDLMEKYKSEVMPELGRKNSNDSKGKKSSKLKTTKSPSTKDFQTNIDCDIDFIQLLPIWIVKKILSYFDNNDLQKFKKINSYWSFASQEIIKERKAREKIDQYLEKMRESIDPKLLDGSIKPASEKKGKAVLKNLGPHHVLAAVDKKLIPKHLKNLCNISLATQAKFDRPSQYDMETGEMIPFPRIIKTGLEFYKFRPCFLQDVGVRFDIDENIEKQKSFLTYSLSSAISSLKISVDEKIFSQW